MLVLTRRQGEALIFHVPGYPEPFVLHVNKIAGGQVKLALAVPDGVKVLRDELEDSKKGGRRASRA